MKNDRFAELYRRFGKLANDLRGRGRQKEDAKDLAQDAMIATWQRIDHIGDGAEWSYTQRSAHNRATNQAKRTREHDDLPEEVRADSDSVEDALIASDFQRQFHEVFSRIDRINRLILIRHAQGATSSEIGKELALDPTAVRSRASRACKLLRERLGPPPPGVKWLEFGDDE